MPDTFNKFMVGKQGDTLVLPMMRQRLSEDDAINLAAWLVALVPDGEKKFDELFSAVLDT